MGRESDFPFLNQLGDGEVAIIRMIVAVPCGCMLVAVMAFIVRYLLSRSGQAPDKMKETFMHAGSSLPTHKDLPRHSSIAKRDVVQGKARGSVGDAAIPSLEYVSPLARMVTGPVDPIASNAGKTATAAHIASLVEGPEDETRQKHVFAPKPVRRNGKVAGSAGAVAIPNRDFGQRRLGRGGIQQVMTATRVRKMAYNRRKADTSIVSES